MGLSIKPFNHQNPGGCIWATQRQPGTTFHFHCPKGQWEVLPEAVAVFVVDDDVSVREALESLIRSAGLKSAFLG